MKSKSISRRDFLRTAGVGTAVLFTGGTFANLLSGCSLAEEAVRPAATLQSTPLRSSPANLTGLEIALSAIEDRVDILPGGATPVWRYQGEVLKGAASALQTLPGSYLGPVLRLRRGQQVRVQFNNALIDPSIIHWHGLHLPEDMDGHPRYAVPAGQNYTYEFTVNNRAGTYWFHPHPHQLTGPQVYYGLAGLFLVSDAEEDEAGLPIGEYDIPLVIQDRTFDADNRLVYLPNGMMDQMNGFLGDRILVNGKPDFTLPVEAGVYRLRLLNGSNSRVYKLAWEDGLPLVVIATDGGLLEKPIKRDYVTLGPGERIELWADFSERRLGSDMRLVSLPFTAGGGGMMGGMMGGMGGMMGNSGALPNGARFEVLRVRIEKKASERHLLPEKLSTISRYQLKDSVNARKPRNFDLFMQQMTGTINGRRFQMDAVADDEVVRLNDLEVWQFANLGGGMGMMGGGSLPHPMHIHGVQFQVLERQVEQAFRSEYRTVSAGFVDEGWKDTVLVMPGERVRVLIKFDDYTGLYLYHCHNLEHEDAGMMRNYRVKA